MRQEGKEAPRGIAVLEDGEWVVPIIFGVDAASKAAAVAFAIDHNNLTLLGGNRPQPPGSRSRRPALRLILRRPRTLCCWTVPSLPLGSGSLEPNLPFYGGSP